MSTTEYFPGVAWAVRDSVDYTAPPNARVLGTETVYNSGQLTTVSTDDTGYVSGAGGVASGHKFRFAVLESPVNITQLNLIVKVQKTGPGGTPSIDLFVWDSNAADWGSALSTATSDGTIQTFTTIITVDPANRLDGSGYLDALIMFNIGNSMTLMNGVYAKLTVTYTEAVTPTTMTVEAVDEQAYVEAKNLPGDIRTDFYNNFDGTYGLTQYFTYDGYYETLTHDTGTVQCMSQVINLKITFDEVSTTLTDLVLSDGLTLYGTYDFSVVKATHFFKVYISSSVLSTGQITVKTHDFADFVINVEWSHQDIFTDVLPGDNLNADVYSPTLNVSAHYAVTVIHGLNFDDGQGFPSYDVSEGVQFLENISYIYRPMSDDPIIIGPGHTVYTSRYNMFTVTETIAVQQRLKRPIEANLVFSDWAFGILYRNGSIVGIATTVDQSDDATGTIVGDILEFDL